jgi:hypothetical protein
MDNKMDGTCNGERRNTYKVLVGKSHRRRSLGISTHRWENNTKIDFKGMGYEDIQYIYLRIGHRSGPLWKGNEPCG